MCKVHEHAHVYKHLQDLHVDVQSTEGKQGEWERGKGKWGKGRGVQGEYEEGKRGRGGVREGRGEGEGVDKFVMENGTPGEFIYFANLQIFCLSTNLADC